MILIVFEPNLIIQTAAEAKLLALNDRILSLAHFHISGKGAQIVQCHSTQRALIMKTAKYFIEDYFQKHSKK